MKKPKTRPSHSKSRPPAHAKICPPVHSGALPELVSANRIAKELKRTPRAVIEKIAALKLEPAATVGGWKLYKPEDIETIGAAMRAPNKPSQGTLNPI